MEKKTLPIAYSERFQNVHRLRILDVFRDDINAQFPRNASYGSNDGLIEAAI